MSDCLHEDFEYCATYSQWECKKCSMFFDDADHANLIYDAQQRRIAELEGTIGLERIAAHKLKARIKELKVTVEELRSARKDWGHQKWLLKMELEGYKALSEAQGFIIDELKVAGLRK